METETAVATSMDELHPVPCPCNPHSLFSLRLGAQAAPSEQVDADSGWGGEG
uniref:Uncharacterized protein n=1 Tax=Arundo donax TaxID=35708 RepID=A0A0A9AS98_ARUDO